MVYVVYKSYHRLVSIDKQILEIILYYLTNQLILYKEYDCKWKWYNNIQLFNRKTDNSKSTQRNLSICMLFI